MENLLRYTHCDGVALVEKTSNWLCPLVRSSATNWLIVDKKPTDRPFQRPQEQGKGQKSASGTLIALVV